MAKKFQAGTDIEAGRVFLEFTYIVKPAVAYIKSELRTYSYVCANQTALKIKRNENKIQ